MKLVLLTVVLFTAASSLAQTGICAQGRECRVNSLTTTSVPGGARTGLNAPGGQIRLGSFNATVGAIWGNGTATTTNYTFATDVGATHLNASSSVTLEIAASVKSTVDTNGFTETAGYVRIVGVANASLPTCNGGSAGAMHYDTTNSCISYCNGTSFACVPRSGTRSTLLQPSFAGYCVTAQSGTSCESDAAPTFLGGYVSPGRAATAAKVTCSFGVIGAGGTTGVVVQVEKSDGTQVCACTLGSCTTAITTLLTCTCSGTLAADAIYGIALDGSSATDCTTNPGNIFCNVTLTE